MSSIYIASTGNHAGQSLIAWGIASILKDKGLKVGFFKPISDHPGPLHGRATDRDVLLMSEVLGLAEPPEAVGPQPLFGQTEHPLEEGRPAKILERISGSFYEISKGKDLTVVMGSNEVFFDKGHRGLPDSRVIESLEAGVLLIHRYERRSSSLYSLLSVYSFLSDRLKAVVINRVPPESLSAVREKLIPFLRGKGMKIPVLIPEDPILASTSLRRIIDRLNGEVLCCHEKADGLVLRHTVGASALNRGLEIFKRVYNKIILIGIPPSGICGVLITGGRLPGEAVILKAERAGIPLIAVKEDTFATLDRLRTGTFPLCREDAFKVKRLFEIAGKEGITEWVEGFFSGII